MTAPTRRLAAVWFADVAGFTKLSSTDESRALLVMDAMRESVRASVASHHGTVIKFLGDGALAEFPSAEGAVEAALEATARFKGLTRELAGGPHRLHIGIHVGDVAFAADGDIFGDGVNRAARLQSLAEPGQILVSEDVARSVRRGPEFQFASLGKRTAKGLDDPFEVFEVQGKGAVAGRLSLLERQTTPPAAAAPAMTARGLARSPRAIGTGIAAGVLAFVGLGIWTAMGGTSEGAIPEMLPLPASDSAFRLPAWPPSAAAAPAAALVPAAEPAATVVSAALTESAAPAPEGPEPSSLAGMAQRATAIFHARPDRDLSSHETLPLLRMAVDVVETGTAKGAQASAVRGLLLWVVARDGQAAEQDFQEAIAADPQAGVLRRMYAQLLTAQGRFGEALFQLEQAKGNGLSEAAYEAARGAVLFREGRFGDAESALERALGRSEDVISTRILLARARMQRGDNDDAADLLTEALPSLSVLPWHAYAQLREKGGELTDVERARFQELAGRPDMGVAAALIYLHLGMPDRAYAVLDGRIEANDPDLLWLGVDPEWTALRNDPQFLRRLARIYER